MSIELIGSRIKIKLDKYVKQSHIILVIDI